MSVACILCRKASQRVCHRKNADILLLRSVVCLRNHDYQMASSQHHHASARARGQSFDSSSCHKLNNINSPDPRLDLKRNSLISFSTSARTPDDKALKPQRPISQTTIDEEEVKKFSRLARLWWDEAGEFEALHSMNELRVPLIRDALTSQRMQKKAPHSLPLEGFSIVDVGSGGGILSEPLARLGATVVGVEASGENVKIAQTHLQQDPRVARRVKYIQATVEDLAATEAERFDAVVASEVVEHVADVPVFVRSCCQLVKPGGSLFFTTLNKTYLSYMLGVVAAENVFRLVYPGTHDWNKFVSPQDLQYILDQNGFSTRLLHGMMYNPATKRWSWITNTSVNYAIHAVKSLDS